MSTAIVTDITTSIPLEIADKYNIHMLPSEVIFGDKIYSDGNECFFEEFYRKMRQSHGLPPTSQATFAEIDKLYSELAETHDDILSSYLVKNILIQ